MSNAVFGDLPLYDERWSYRDAQLDLQGRGLTDGLPVVAPTASTLDAMLAGVEHPEHVYGQVPVLFGSLTQAAVAYHACLAGCTPDELDVVFAAVLAALEPEFNLLGIQTTTGSPTTTVIVHGGVAERLGMSSGAGCLGPGNRANACIGRGIRLALANIGGIVAGATTMSTLAQPGRFTCCLAEQAHSPFPGLAEARGFAPGDDAVTVVGTGGILEVVTPHTGDPEAVIDVLAGAMVGAALGGASSAGMRSEGGEQLILLPPEVAGGLHNAGWTLAKVTEALSSRACLSGDQLTPGIRAMFSEGPGPSGTVELRAAPRPGDVLVVVAGGVGVKMAYLPGWSGGTRSVTRPVVALRKAPGVIYSMQRKG